LNSVLQVLSAALYILDLGIKFLNLSFFSIYVTRISRFRHFISCLTY
jgi:hypothetical protein